MRENKVNIDEINYSKLLQGIIDIAEEMLVAGAEVSRVNDCIRRMCAAYGCIEGRTNAFIITSNIQVTIESPAHEIITQIRMVERNDTNYDILDELNNLSRYVCKNTPEPNVMRRMFLKIMNRPKHNKWIGLLGVAMAAGGFAIFFGGDFIDGIIGAVLGIFMAQTEKIIAKYDGNTLAKVFMTSILGGLFAIVMVYSSIIFLNQSPHIDKIIIGGIMILIPGIALTNSIRDMLIGDIATGLLRFSNSLLIAIAISCGFALSLLFLGDSLALRQSDAMFLDNAYYVQIISAFVGSFGFAIFFNIKGKKIPYAGLGGGATWWVYLILQTYLGAFVATLIASIFVGIFAEVMARISRTPATIFLTAAAIPLIPGSSLYYTMAGMLLENSEQIRTCGIRCITLALAIALGFMIVAITNKYYLLIKNKRITKATSQYYAEVAKKHNI